MAESGFNCRLWCGKKVAFLGDSITDKCPVGTTKNYWDFLAEWLAITPLVYGLNGQMWRHAVAQGEKLLAEHGDDVDAIFLFFGTNDYNNSTPLGTWWRYQEESVNSHGVVMTKRRRIPVFDETTLCGRINGALDFLKTHFVRQQIVILTPIHRGSYANGESNIQVPESFPNDIDLYFDENCNTILFFCKRIAKVRFLHYIILLTKRSLWRKLRKKNIR